MFASGCGHFHIPSTYLFCPGCTTPREAKRGLIDTKSGLQPIWYLGCGCAKPKGLI